MNSKARKLDLSAKFLEMGQALQLEGEDNKDIEIIVLGTILIVLSSLLLSEKDLYKFSELVNMFLAKQTIDRLTRDNHPIIGVLKNLSDTKSYDDIIDDLNNKKEETDDDDE